VGNPPPAPSSSPAPTSVSPAQIPAPVPAQLPTELPGINLPQGLRRLAGNQTLYRSLLGKFFTGYAQTAEEIRQTLQSGDLATAERLAHTLKGVAGNLGAERLAAAATALDAVLKTTDPNSTSIPAEWEPVASALAEVHAGLAAWMEQSSASPELSPPVAPTANATSSSDLLPLLAELKQLAEAADFGAKDACARLEERLRGTLLAARLAPITAALDRYDFPAAAQAAENLHRALSQP
jgi:two-component system, sensor histidine kinase and response regulator